MEVQRRPVIVRLILSVKEGQAFNDVLSQSIAGSASAVTVSASLGAQRGSRFPANSCLAIEETSETKINDEPRC